MKTSTNKKSKEIDKPDIEKEIEVKELKKKTESKSKEKNIENNEKIGEKEENKSKEKSDEVDVKWEKIDDKKSIITEFLGVSYRSGPWKRINPSKIYLDAMDVHYITLDYDDVIGNDKGYLEYKDGRKLLVYEGNFEDSIPVGTHIQYLPDKNEKKTEWICRKHFDKKKTGILLSYDTRIKGKEIKGLKCENPNPFTEDPKVEIKKNTKTVPQLRKECKEYGISLKKSDRKVNMENKIKKYLKNKNEE
jgi:hypothetical protein